VKPTEEPNRDDRPSSVRRLLYSPLSDLLQGCVTGHGDWQILLNDANLPPVISECIATHLAKTSRRGRLERARQVIAWASEEVSAQRPLGQIVESITSAASASDLADVATLLEDELPTPSLESVRSLVARTKLRGRKRVRLTHDLLQLFRKRLAQGESLQPAVETCASSIALPALIRQTGGVCETLEAELPEKIMARVDDVLRRTRLWTSEKSEVASELAAHFGDGLAAGQSPEELIEDFGKPALAARLIRRARLRCRPWSWHAARRTGQTAAALFVLVIVLWGALIVRFRLAQPVLAYDVVAEIDAAAAAVAPQDRGWPLYRQGFVELGDDYREAFNPNDGVNLRQAFLDGPSSAAWPQAKAFVDEHPLTLALFFRGAERPRLGFQHRDLENAEWLQAMGRPASAAYNPPGTPAWHVLLTHTDVLRLAARFFSATTYEAAERGDADDVVRGIQALLQAARHVREDGFLITQLIGAAFARTASERTLALLREKPEMFSDEHLDALGDSLAIDVDDDWQLDWDAENQRFVDDFLQHAYSPEGRFTAQGLRYLRFVFRTDADLSFVPLDYESGVLDLPDSLPLQDRLIFDLFGSEATAWLADRTAMQQKFDELRALFTAEDRQTEWSRETSKFYRELERIRSSWRLRRRYLPVLAFYQCGILNVEWARQTSRGPDCSRVARNGALVAIALEQYRRRNDEWPDSLQNLIPEHLMELPIDPMSGGALRYELRDGQPFVYSLGPDRDDDGGEPMAKKVELDPSAKGDWVVYPVDLD